MKDYIVKKINSSVGRFLISGGITFICEYAVFIGLYIYLSWNLILANSLSFGVGLSISFLLNRSWAFKHNEYTRKIHHQVLMYVVLALSNLVINNSIVAGLSEAGITPKIGKIIAIAIIAIWNFIIYKSIVFAKSD